MADREKIRELIMRERRQFLAAAALSAGAVGLTALLHFSGSHVFQRVIGNANPMAASLAIASLGFILLSLFLFRGWFAIYKKENLKALWRSSALAALLGTVMILIDLEVVFPAGMNVPFPESLVFYPAMDFFAQVLFHVLPLSVLLFALAPIFGKTGHENIVWICILAVALLEPAYQTLWSASSRLPSWAVAYVGLHVFLINLSELAIFRRYDFVSMFVFRLVYYLFWHIGWGHVRLKILF